MKRQRETKLKPQKKYTGRILINNKVGGELIGNRGCIIKSIRDAYKGCRIDLPDSNHKFRVVQVCCEEHEELANAMTEITDKMRHCTKDFGLDINPEHGGVQVLINGPLISLVEGGITFLRDLGCTLDFPTETIEDSGDRKLVISGDMSSINATLKKLYEKFSNEDLPNGDIETWFDPNDGKGGPRQREKYPDKYPRISNDNDGKTVFRVLLPSNRAAVMIGKKGAVIKEMREAHGCRVEINDIAGQYKVCKVIGEDEEDVFNTLEKMLDHLEKAMEEDMNLKKGVSGIKYLIHQSLAGKVIGTKGEEIKKTREEAGCEFFKINGETIQGTTDRVISAESSDKHAIIKAMRIVHERLKDISPRGEQRRLEDIMPRTDGKGGQDNRGPPPPQHPHHHQPPPQTYYGAPPPAGWQPPPQQYYQPPAQYSAPPPVYGAPYGAPPPQQQQPDYYRGAPAPGPPAQVNSFQQHNKEWQQRAPNSNNYSQQRW